MRQKVRDEKEDTYDPICLSDTFHICLSDTEKEDPCTE